MQFIRFVPLVNSSILSLVFIFMLSTISSLMDICGAEFGDLVCVIYYSSLFVKGLWILRLVFCHLLVEC